VGRGGKRGVVDAADNTSGIAPWRGEETPAFVRNKCFYSSERTVASGLALANLRCAGRDAAVVCADIGDADQELSAAIGLLKPVFEQNPYAVPEPLQRWYLQTEANSYASHHRPTADSAPSLSRACRNKRRKSCRALVASG
jgi:hypothetical protein